MAIGCFAGAAKEHSFTNAMDNSQCSTCWLLIQWSLLDPKLQFIRQQIFAFPESDRFSRRCIKNQDGPSWIKKLTKLERCKSSTIRLLGQTTTNHYQPLTITTNNLLEDIKLLEDDIASEKKILLFQKKINLSAFQSWMVAPGDAPRWLLLKSD